MAQVFQEYCVVQWKEEKGRNSTSINHSCKTFLSSFKEKSFWFMPFLVGDAFFVITSLIELAGKGRHAGEDGDISEILKQVQEEKQQKGEKLKILQTGVIGENEKLIVPLLQNIVQDALTKSSL